MAPRYRVTLEAAEREEVLAVTRSGKTSSKVFVSARVLLLRDLGPDGPAWTVATTAEALGVTARTIEHIKRRFVEQGLAAALRREARQRKPRAVTFDGAFEARRIALACSQVPSGRRRWTVRLLAEEAVDLGLAPSVSPMTVQRTLRKTNSSI